MSDRGEGMNLKAVHHVAIIVSDYEKSREFYVDKLGFEIRRENFREKQQDYKLDLVLNGVEWCRIGDFCTGKKG